MAISKSPLARSATIRGRRRRGNVLALTAIFMVPLMAMIALAVDIGYLCHVQAELQRAADSAALAGASALFDPETSLDSSYYALSPDTLFARQEARRFSNANTCDARIIDAQLNESNDSSGDIVLGRLNTPWDVSELLDTEAPVANTVSVHIRLTGSHANGPVSLFFAPVIGVVSTELSATASATVWYPALLPFATAESNWQNLENGGAGDNFAYNGTSVTFGVSVGSDGVKEMIMFPGSWNGQAMPPGNFGVLQIGPGGSEMTNLRRQVDMGPSEADFEHHGGSLNAGDVVSGRTGLKSSSKHAFLGGHADARTFGGILGQLRVLPLYESVSGRGSNAQFTLSRFVNVRVMAVQIDGRWRTQRNDTEGEAITSIAVQPIGDTEQLLQSRLTR